MNKLYSMMMNFFVKSTDEFKSDQVVCEIDGIEEDCFIGKIESQGYKYDSGNDWYERTWTTESEPKESIREVYQRLENGEWNQ